LIPKIAIGKITLASIRLCQPHPAVPRLANHLLDSRLGESSYWDFGLVARAAIHVANVAVDAGLEAPAPNI